MLALDPYPVWLEVHPLSCRCRVDFTTWRFGRTCFRAALTCPLMVALSEVGLGFRCITSCYLDLLGPACSTQGTDYTLNCWKGTKWTTSVTGTQGGGHMGPTLGIRLSLSGSVTWVEIGNQTYADRIRNQT